MIKYLIGLAVLVGIYFYMYYTPKSIQEPMGNIVEPFVASDKFAGAKEGYVFKMDSEGLGYYLDVLA